VPCQIVESLKREEVSTFILVFTGYIPPSKSLIPSNLKKKPTKQLFGTKKGDPTPRALLPFWTEFLIHKFINSI
jgi:hypothetical protein